MYILHLSDLHVTESGQTLDDVWMHPAQALGTLHPAPFDFVVVSGDLTQRGSAAEYDELLEFAEHRVLPLVVNRERARVVFVPGNHDVDWGADIGEPVRVTSLRTAHDFDLLEQEMQRLKRSPDLSDLRIDVGRYGHLDLVKLRAGAEYNKRFANVQRFFDRFYGESLDGRGRAFDLLDSNEREHWSAHVFPQEKVAFFGFNSCHRNDKYWTGAAISTRAVSAARDFANGLDRDTLRVAVWHHGFTSERGRPDYLTLQDVGTLYAAGFRIGFHGHTHQESSKLVELFKSRFVIISTGSLGSAAHERPGAVGNQFSVVRLSPSTVSVEVYERDGEAGEYALEPKRKYFEVNWEPVAQAERFVKAREHTRIWSVGDDGIALVEVELRDFVAPVETPIAVLEPPYNNVQAEPRATTWRGRREVKEEPLGGGRVRFMLQGADKTERYLTWSYHLSNAVALTQAELNLLEKRDRWYPNLIDGYDVRSHVVRFESDHLTLALVFAESSGATIEDAYPMVERCYEQFGEERWEPVEFEQERCRSHFIVGKTHVELKIPGPIVGYRYSLAYRPGGAGKEYPEAAKWTARALLERCCGKPMSNHSLSAKLTEAVGNSIYKIATASPWGVQTAPIVRSGLLSERGSWMGMIWDANLRVLCPAFGQFWPQSWAARFTCGSGVAGHAFRFNIAAAWHRDAHATTSIIYQPSPDHHRLFARHYRWILCFPLRLAPEEESSLGVVCLASEEENTQVERALGHLARAICTETMDPEATKLRLMLQTVINAVFWTCVTDPNHGLSESEGRYARHVLNALLSSATD
ncbi:metallophosphoesterase [Polyangium sp. 15x6]|uniref:metallophosphoesterase family protein n=1 Tax=Polyangium sp. 15x6 TaxID=3042687 RepID=UPI002499C119|nr:metallophosphoesterase [Polyangium sp. 15x6]MDI3288957.1 metallophosphoesterase [Polyangium sp. 15x6]